MKKLFHAHKLNGGSSDVSEREGAVNVSNRYAFNSQSETDDGFLVSGTFLTGKNLNGYTYAPDAFDEFINEYFVEHGYNVPLRVEHDYSFNGIAGKVSSIKKLKDNSGYQIEAVVSKNAPAGYDRIVALIKEGILQGFSDSEAVIDYDYIESSNEIYIKKANLFEVSLVSMPASIDAHVDQAGNTTFVGFRKKKKNKGKDKKKSCFK